MATLSQDTRVGKFQTVLGKDKLALTSFEGREGLSELFKFRVNCLASEEKPVDFDRLLGTDCHVELATRHNGVSRFFHGVITEAEFQDYVGGLPGYQIVLRPWLWLLSRTRNCRIFNDMSVTEIIREVLGHYGYAHFEMRMPDTFPQLEYCVQYRESDFDFISRLMEENVIFYNFEHSEDQHLMVLTTGSNDNKPKPGGMDIAFDSSEQSATRKEDFITDFLPRRRFYTSKFLLKDFDYKKPKAELLVTDDHDPKFDKRSLDYYDYPGGYIDQGEGSQLAMNKGIQEQRRDYSVFATGDALTCCPGKLMKLFQHPEDTFNTQYLVRRAEHVFKSNQYHSGSDDSDHEYQGEYELIWKLTEFSPPSVTTKPVIPGPQTAFVATEMDEQSRVKVIFHWERDKKHSRYVRIGQGWAGAGWGDFKIPRIGMEVIVEFLNGDPDYPLITGCVYNGDNKPPYDTPTKSGTKSQNYHSGSGYNELMFDDKDGAQLVRLHAQKDMEGVIEEKETRSVGTDSTLTIGNKSDITIGNSRTETIGMNSTLAVGSSLTETIGMSWSATSGTSISFVCGASSIVMSPAGIVITSPNIVVTASAAMAVSTGSAFALTSGGAVAITAGAAVAITAGGPAVFHGVPPIVA